MIYWIADNYPSTQVTDK